jgi:hypothetical protein
LEDVRALEARVDAFDVAFREQEVDTQDAADVALAADTARTEMQTRVLEMETSLADLRERIEPMEAAEEDLVLWRDLLTGLLTEPLEEGHRVSETAAGLTVELPASSIFDARTAKLNQNGVAWLDAFIGVLVEAPVEACVVEMVWESSADDTEEVPWSRMGQRVDPLMFELSRREVHASPMLRVRVTDSEVGAQEWISFTILPRFAEEVSLHEEAETLVLTDVEASQGASSP